MEGGTISPVFLENERLPCSSHEVLDSLWISNSPPPAFHGIEFILSFFSLLLCFLFILAFWLVLCCYMLSVAVFYLWVTRLMLFF